MKNTFAVSVITLLALTLASCTLEPYVISSEEEYTRNFIKKFGLIDPEQDWNQAKAMEISVNVGTGAKRLKLYAKVGERYYIIADYYDVVGIVNIPVDVLEDTKDLLAEADGRKYYGTVGTTINCTGAASRSATASPIADFPALSELTTVNYSYSVGGGVGAALKTQLNKSISTNTTHTIGGTSYTVTSGYLTNENDVRAFEFFNAQQIAPITSDAVWRDYYSLNGNTLRQNPFTTNSGFGLIPESGFVPGYGNTINPGITQNFTIRASEGKFAIYPMYWNSCQIHELGVYLYKEDGEVLKDDLGDIALFPIFIDKRNQDGSADLYVYNKTSTISTTVGDEWKGGSDDCLATLPVDLLRSYFNNDGTPKSQYLELGSDGYYHPGTDFLTFKVAYVAAFNNHSNWSYFSSIFSGKENWRMVNFRCGNWQANGDITFHFTFEDPSTYPSATDVASYLSENGGTYNVAKINNLDLYYTNSNNEQVRDQDCSSYSTQEPLRLKNRAYFVYLPDDYTRKFGMYIKYNDIMYSNGPERVLYSENRFNPSSRADDGDSYACSFTHPMSDRTFFSFEDWLYKDASDKDLNDLVFRLANFDEITGDQITETSDTPISWIWAVEDLGSTDDFDFNDIVIKIESVTTNVVTTNTVEGTKDTRSYKKVTFTPLAAGGTLPTFIHWQKSVSEDYVLAPGVYVEDGAEYSPTVTSIKNLSTLALSVSGEATEREYHNWFGGATSHSQMINTGRTYVSQDKIKNCVIYVNTSFSISGFGSSKAIVDGNGKGLYISINGPTAGENTANVDAEKALDTNYNVSASQTGAPAQMFIILDNNWRWPLERTHITNAYPDFPNWISDKTIDWTTNCKTSEVFSR